VVTLRADFLAYPAWLALQKADLILGPIGVGLYWRRRRPQSPFGPMLVAFGFLHVPYILQSSENSALFTVGVHWEGVIYLATLALILAFPSGRFGRLDRLILIAGALLAVVPNSAIVLLSPSIFAGGSISACREACPGNALFVGSYPELVTRLVDIDRAAIITIALGTAALLVWRLATGSPPRRRALAIGTPIALVFLFTQAGYQISVAFDPAESGLNTFLRWSFVVARSALWYGFLFALVAAQIFAARVLRQMVGESLRRPSLGELESLLRGPLGDPGLRLAFSERDGDVLTDSEGAVVGTPGTGSGRALTQVPRQSGRTAAFVHDVQLADDPELLQAAGATALLALENAELEAAWSDLLRELHESRSRIAAAGDLERRHLEQDLHDGAQQTLVATRVALGLITEELGDDGGLHGRLSAVEDGLDRAIAELRALAHGIYPALLADEGLVPALKAVAARSPRVTVTGDRISRYPPEIETGLYYCCREAITNVIKHAGEDARVWIRLLDTGDELHFEVRDDGVGFDPHARREGGGLRNIEDRIGTLDGWVTFSSRPGNGTVVSGFVPLRR
jgi:signal transduction histidine kinase